MSDFERELVKIIKFKSTDYADRQDYLAALARAADKWFAAKDKDQSIFDSLDDGLQGWFEGAITAMNTRPPAAIPDFPDLEVMEPIEPAEEDENVDEGAADTTEEAEVAVPEASSKADSTGGEAPAPKAKKAKKPKVDKATRYDDLTGEKNRYGVTLGTKTHDAIMMYEKGCTSKDIDKALEGKHYNILRRLAKEGHRVEKLPGGVFKLTHKDDLDKKPERSVPAEGGKNAEDE